MGKVRAMINHEGKNINEAHPSMPVEILGMNGTAFAGAEFFVTENENKAKEIVEFKKVGSTSKKTISLKIKPLYSKIKKIKKN